MKYWKWEREKFAGKKVADGRRTVLIYNSLGSLTLKATWEKVPLTECVSEADFQCYLEFYGEDYLRDLFSKFARGYAWGAYLQNVSGCCLRSEYFADERDARDWCWSQDP